MKALAWKRPPLRQLVTAGSLVFAWCALWGEVTLANLASGALIAGLVTASGVGTGGRGGVRLRPLVRFAALVAVDLVVSTANVAREVLTPSDRTDEAIIALRVPTGTRSHLLLLIVAVTVTPGTAVVDADPDTGTLYLHLLHHDHRPQLEWHVQELARLACAALPSPTHGALAHPTAAAEQELSS
jgi:multicomponent Na+:H+ antiporter subunit E